MEPMLGVDKSKKPKGIIILVVLGIVLAVIIAFLWYWTDVRRERQQIIQEQQRTAEAVQSVVSPPALPTESVTPQTNPVEGRLPEVNPIERANPFTDEYENPFE